MSSLANITRTVITRALQADARLEVVRRGTQPAKDFAGKRMLGVRGGVYGQFTATTVYQEANAAAADRIEAVLVANGFVKVERSDMHIVYVRSGIEIKFLLVTIESGSNSVYWWVLC